MTAAEQEWVPGDPLMPDRGLGSHGVSPMMTAAERAAALADDTGDAPPWWRPDGSGVDHGLAATHTCKPCGVRWRGDDPCWMCGGEQIP